MVKTANLAQITDQHRMLEKQIIEEMARPMADSLRISKLKREKLRLKEEIALIIAHSQEVA
tara:strand:+ start:99 stop:281 length:183 start_codon:yes stop_codon:yes gene_type:complete